MKYKKSIDNVSMVLAGAGGINWGSIGLFGYNIVGAILPSGFERLVYVLVGAGTVWLIAKVFK